MSCSYGNNDPGSPPFSVEWLPALVQRAAVTGARAQKARHRAEVSVLLEQLNLLWELVHHRRWISQQQLVFVAGKLGEAGRMTGGWLKQARGSGSGALASAALPS